MPCASRCSCRPHLRRARRPPSEQVLRSTRPTERSRRHTHRRPCASPALEHAIPHSARRRQLRPIRVAQSPRPSRLLAGGLPVTEVDGTVRSVGTQSPTGCRACRGHLRTELGQDGRPKARNGRAPCLSSSGLGDDLDPTLDRSHLVESQGQLLDDCVNNPYVGRVDANDLTATSMARWSRRSQLLVLAIGVQ